MKWENFEAMNVRRNIVNNKLEYRIKNYFLFLYVRTSRDVYAT